MMTSDAKRALAKTIRELREKIILPDLRRPAGRGGLPAGAEGCGGGAGRELGLAAEPLLRSPRASPSAGRAPPAPRGAGRTRPAWTGPASSR